MKNRILFILSFLLLSYASTWAQEKEDPNQNFFIQGRMIDETPYIKIIPGDQGAWYLGMKYGYKISISLYENEQFSEYKIVISDLRPAPKKDFEDADLPSDYAAAMRKMIYEEDYAPLGNSFDDMLAADDKMNLLHYSYLLISSYNPQLSVMCGLQTPIENELTNQFKIKIEIIDHPEYNYEQTLFKKLFYTDVQSPNFELVQGDRETKVEWMHHDYEKLFIAYIIERSTNGKDFVQIGVPRLFNSSSDAGRLGMMSVSDSLPENYKKYWYHVRGFDAFGFLSEPGEALVIEGKDMKAPDAPKKVSALQTSPDIITVQWEAPDGPDLAGFQVIASKSEKGQYDLLHEKLLAPSQTAFNYNITNGLYRYYRVLAVDTARNARASDLAYLVVYDTIPPEIPINIQVVVDTLLIARISWSASKDVDIEGYRVFKSYHPSHGFVSITPMVVRDTLFMDTLSAKRLDKKVYYQVLALDQHYNHSQPSAYVAAIVPDFIPPTKPLLIKAELSNTGLIELEWKPSSSADVASYNVIRKSENDTIFQKVNSAPVGTDMSVDLTFDELNLNAAEYYIVAIDSSGNPSDYSNGKRVTRLKTSSNEMITNIIVNDWDDRVELSWNYSSDKTYSVLVYRAEEGEAFSLIDRVNEQSEYVDRSVKSGKKYRYKLGVLESTGKRSALSEEATVKLK